MKPKYRIRELAIELQLQYQRQGIKKVLTEIYDELAAAAAVKRRTVFYWTEYKQGEKGSINSDNLLQVANFFNVSVDHIFNN